MLRSHKSEMSFSILYAVMATNQCQFNSVLDLITVKLDDINSVMSTQPVEALAAYFIHAIVINSL